MTREASATATSATVASTLGSSGKSGCGPVRASRRSRWRAISLILVHVVIAAHIVQWWITGTTLTPVEPSEAIQTLGEGLVNAGFVLFVLLILSTLLLGRFFCGWGCHVVALQDLCSWLLARVGIRPQPFRSRLLMWVPLASAVWLFVAPSLVRWWAGVERPEFQAHFMTDDFWGRFPGPFVALLTFFVCGFLIVYLLGNKAFCTYGCPYGGVFGVADKVAPGRIRVTDACEGCGHCTATCTSNVRVHEEVRTYGMVVNPGCMKCMDCVSVCPKEALYFGFGRTAVNKGQPRLARKARKYDYTWAEEAGLAATFLLSVVILRALYGAVPFLLALGLSAISACVLVTAARTFYARDVRFARLRLRGAGRTTGTGSLFLIVIGAWILFLAHSAVIQYTTIRGERDVKHAIAEAMTTGGTLQSSSRRTLEQGLKSLRFAESYGLFAPPNLLVLIASGHSHLGDHSVAQSYYGRVAAAAPDFASARFEYGRYLAAAGHDEQAIVHFWAALEREPGLPGAAGMFVDLLLQSPRRSQAPELLQQLLERRPGNVELRLAHGVALAELGDLERGIAVTQAVLREVEGHARGHFNLGQMLAKSRQFEAALAALQRARELHPQNVDARLLLVKVAARLELWEVALAEFDWLRAQDPFDRDYIGGWALTIAKAGQLDAAIAAAEAVRSSDRAARFRLAFLYHAAGREAEAQEIAAEFAE
ncbi:MAG: tetratricopeptide repeat protein [Planctomycetota bacterium]